LAEPLETLLYTILIWVLLRSKNLSLTGVSIQVVDFCFVVFIAEVFIFLVQFYIAYPLTL